MIKIDGKNGQQLRVKITPAQLHSDRESLFYLNLPDIPPLPENSGLNLMGWQLRDQSSLAYARDRGTNQCAG